MDITQPAAYGTINLWLCQATEVNSVHAVAALIREVPGVVRVGVDPQKRGLEIRYRESSDNLLHKIHTALVSARTDLPAAAPSSARDPQTAGDVQRSPIAAYS